MALQPPDRQALGQQQPMSLMTISSPKTTGRGLASGTESELLTLRILEASERKMQLIKKLLTPEEYNSLSSDLFANDFESLTRDLSTQRRLGIESSELHSPRATSIPATLARPRPKIVDRHSADGMHFRRVKLSSRSETSLVRLRDAHTTESLARRRRAMEFFFSEADNNQLSKSTTSERLAVELRSGHSFDDGSHADDKLTSGPSLRALWHLLLATVRLIGLSCLLTPSSTTTAQPADGSGPLESVAEKSAKEFVQRYKGTLCSPYSNEANLYSMAARLRRDGQLNQVLGRPPPKRGQLKRRVASEPTKTSLKLVLSRQASVSMTSIPYRPSARLDTSANAQCDNNCVHSKPPSALSRKDSRILVHHRWVRAMLTLLGERSNEFEAADLELMSSKKVELRFHQLLVVEHNNLMLAEERLAQKVREQHREYMQLRARFIGVQTKLANILQQLPGILSDTAVDVLAKMFELRSKSLERMLLKQQQLVATYEELKATRAKQQFSATSLSVGSKAGNTRQQYSLRGPLGELASSFAEHEHMRRARDLLVRLAEAELEIEQLVEMHLDEAGAEIAPEQQDNLPSEEIERRLARANWCRSLRLRLRMGKQVRELSVTRVDENWRLHMDKLTAVCFEFPSASRDRLALGNSKLSVVAQLVRKTKFGLERVEASGRIELRAPTGKPLDKCLG